MTTTQQWTPPCGLDSELVQAGVQWDAVRAPAYLGDRVTARLGEDSGAVICDPYAQRMYWLILPGMAASWVFPDISYVQVLGTASWVAVPPRDRESPPGPHWAKPVTEGSALTDPSALHTALTAAVGEALGPREAAAP